MLEQALQEARRVGEADPMGVAERFFPERSESGEFIHLMTSRQTLASFSSRGKSAETELLFVTEGFP
jgi:hypothetical protein